MKKIFPVFMILSFLLFAFAIPAGAVPGEQNGNSLSAVEPGGSAYLMVTKLKPGELEFKCGWHNSDVFEFPSHGYVIYIADLTEMETEWNKVVTLDASCPKMLKVEFDSDVTDIELDPGHEYRIIFGVRGAKVIVQVDFTAP